MTSKTNQVKLDYITDLMEREVKIDVHLHSGHKLYGYIKEIACTHHVDFILENDDNSSLVYDRSIDILRESKF